MITPQEFAACVSRVGTTIPPNPNYGQDERQAKEFLDSATVAQLTEGVRLAIKSQSPWNGPLIEQALRTLDIRVKEESAQATEKHIRHTEKLTNQTATLITESQNLTAQNKLLVLESKRLNTLTKVLVWFTVGLFLLTGVLVWAECRKETHTVKVITNPVTVTNVPVLIVISNAPAPILTNIHNSLQNQ